VGGGAPDRVNETNGISTANGRDENKKFEWGHVRLGNFAGPTYPQCRAPTVFYTSSLLNWFASVDVRVPAPLSLSQTSAVRFFENKTPY